MQRCNDGQQWSTMVNNGQQWSTMVNNGQQWSTVVKDSGIEREQMINLVTVCWRRYVDTGVI